jgi:hypothetical protein
MNLTEDDLTNPRNPVGQKEIIEELKRHHHPSSRKMPNGSSRNTDEARHELIQHYIYAHNLVLN